MIRPFLSVMLAILAIMLAEQPALAQSAAPAPPGPAYRINPGDDLEVLVWGDERLQRDVKVLPDGTFEFPLVGQVQASGRVASEIEQSISKGLQPQYRGAVPAVTVTVKSPSGYQFSVVGKVKSPGTFTPGRYVNALEAIAAAGGPTDFADVNDITVLRKVGQQLQTVYVRLGSVLKGDTSHVTASQVPLIQSGDTIVVP